MGLTAFLPAGPLALKIAVESVKGREIEGHLIWPSARQQDELANGLYSVDWHREFLHRTAYFPTPSDIVLSYLLLQSPLEKKQGRWQAVLFGNMASGSMQYGIMADTLNEKGSASLITFRNFAPGDKTTGLVFSEDGTAPIEFTVADEEPLASLVQKGLDGASVRRYRMKLNRNLT
jgi:hypothetical protein